MVIDQRGLWAISAVEVIGIDAASSGWSGTAKKASVSLRDICIKAMKQNRRDAYRIAIESLERVGLASANHHLQGAVQEAAKALDEVGVAAIEGGFSDWASQALMGLDHMVDAAIPPAPERPSQRVEYSPYGRAMAQAFMDVGAAAHGSQMQEAADMAASGLKKIAAAFGSNFLREVYDEAVTSAGPQTDTMEQFFRQHVEVASPL
jgi:hypothetical protein